DCFAPAITWYHASMKPTLVAALILLALAVALWGCDLGGLPTSTPVPAQPTSTPSTQARTPVPAAAPSIAETVPTFSPTRAAPESTLPPVETPTGEATAVIGESTATTATTATVE